MKHSPILVSIAAAGLATSLTLAAQARRSVAPSNGAPEVSSQLDLFEYSNGAVMNHRTTGSGVWNLHTNPDDASSTASTIRASVYGRTGGTGQTMNCSGVMVFEDGAVTLGNSGSLSAGCNNAGDNIADVPSLNSGMFYNNYFVRCSMPAKGSCPSMIYGFDYVGSNTTPPALLRTASPSDGKPYPATNYAHFEYANGVVRHTFTGATENWDLTAHIDRNGANKYAIVRAKGNASTGVNCWGYALDVNGAAVIGNGMSTPAGCSGNPAQIQTPNVFVAQSIGYFGVTCQLPAAQSGCDPRIAYYRYTN